MVVGLEHVAPRLGAYLMPVVYLMVAPVVEQAKRTAHLAMIILKRQ
ncbi:hypothetical protein EVA_06758 [gut metagenome]|uniref:Uncharacterized protein n=1 Tax=gut metagenome TaxID=749906 RepID=J9CY08_9ZZZZ